MSLSAHTSPGQSSKKKYLTQTVARTRVNKKDALCEGSRDNISGGKWTRAPVSWDLRKAATIVVKACGVALTFLPAPSPHLELQKYHGRWPTTSRLPTLEDK